MIFSLFGSRLDLLHLREFKIMCLNFVGERTQKCDRENRECGGVRSNIYRLHLDLVVKQLCHNATFRNQKLCYGKVFLFKNDETKNSSGL